MNTPFHTHCLKLEHSAVVDPALLLRIEIGGENKLRVWGGGGGVEEEVKVVQNVKHIWFFF